MNRIVLVAMWGLWGCATSHGAQTQPAGGGAAEEQVTQEGQTGIPPEKIEDIQRVLTTHREGVTRCWRDEAERQHKRDLAIDLQIKLTVGTGGKASIVSVLKDSASAKEFDACVIEAVKQLDFPTLPESLELTWDYSLKAL